MEHPLQPFLVTALATLGLLAASIHWLGPRGWMDHPDARKHHGSPTPRVGGVVLLVMLAMGQASGRLVLPFSPWEWTTIYGMGLLGVLDDRFNLRPRWKASVGLLLAFPLAAATTWALLHDGTDIRFFGFEFPEHGPLVFSLLLLWFWAVPQAFNLIDGINGLLIGLAALLLLFTGFGPGQAPFFWGILAALFLGNYPRAHHFLGDGGALPLGTLFAILVMKVSMPHHAAQPLWLLAYPIVDVSTVVAIRMATRQSLGAADRNHLHHWMMDRFPGRAWLTTLVLLGLAVLPMFRGTAMTGAELLSNGGYLLLVGLAIVNFRFRLSEFRAVHAKISVRRPIPGVASRAVRGEPSGAHSLK